MYDTIKARIARVTRRQIAIFVTALAAAFVVWLVIGLLLAAYYPE